MQQVPQGVAQKLEEVCFVLNQNQFYPNLNLPLALVHAAPIYSYSKSKGVFVGVTLEGTLILTRKKTNAKFYGSSVTAHDLLSGKIPAPAQAEPFYRMLNIKFGHLGTGLAKP